MRTLVREASRRPLQIEPAPPRMIEQFEVFRRGLRTQRPRKLPLFGREVSGTPRSTSSLRDARIDSHRRDLYPRMSHQISSRRAPFRTCKLPRLAVRIAPIVVVNAVGNVGKLLNLAQYQASADRVHRAGRNEDCVARVHRHVNQSVFSRPVRDHLHKRFPRDASFATRPALPRRVARSPRTTSPSFRGRPQLPRVFARTRRRDEPARRACLPRK